MIGDKPNWTDRLKGININMMIEFAGRINYLEDKLEDLKSREATLIANIEVLKHRLQELEDKIIPEHLNGIENYGGSK